MKSNKTSLGKTQVADGNGVHKAAEKLLLKQAKIQLGQQSSVFVGHVTHGLEDRTA